MVNRNAVAGYSMRVAEKHMTRLSVEAQKLRIRERNFDRSTDLRARAVNDMRPIEGAVSPDVPRRLRMGSRRARMSGTLNLETVFHAEIFSKRISTSLPQKHLADFPLSCFLFWAFDGSDCSARAASSGA